MTMYPSHDDWVYTAGLVDGEGSIGVYSSRLSGKPHRTPMFSIYLMVINTHESTLRWLERVFGGHVVSRRVEPGRQQVFVWQMFGHQAARMLKRLEPILRIKQQQARLTIMAWDQRGNIRDGDPKEEVIARREAFKIAIQRLHHGEAA